VPSVNAQCLDLFGFCDASDADRIILISANVDEALVPLAEDKVGGGRDIQVFDVEAWRGLPDADEIFGARIGKRLEEDAFQDAENNGVRPNTGGQGDQRNGGEHRSASQPAENLSQLVPKFTHASPPGGSAIVQGHVGVAPVNKYEIAGKKFLRRWPAWREFLRKPGFRCKWRCWVWKVGRLS
jgi:hypothetical protein